MKSLTRRLVVTWTGLGPRFLPFADAATPDLPLSRLLRLSLFQVSVGMALVLLVGTLNRVMIVELGVPASLVAIMISLPVICRAVPRADRLPLRHTTARALGWRRVPFIWKGTMLQFGGLAIMPFALLVLSGGGNAGQWPAWIGQLGAGLAFLLVGAGLHTMQTVGLALATDLAPPESQPKVVGLMYVMLLVGMIVSALVFGALLADFTPGPPDPGDPGRRPWRPSCSTSSRCGSRRRARPPRGAAPAREPPASASPGDSFSQRRPAPCAAWSRSASARWPSACRTCCSSPMAARCCGMTRRRDHAADGHARRWAGCSASAGVARAGPRRRSRSAWPSYGALVGIPAFVAVILAAPLAFGAAVRRRRAC